MSQVTIKSNGNKYELYPFYALDEKTQREFDYIKEEQIQDYRFVKYRGNWYDINDMQMITVESQMGRIGWQMDVTKDSPFAVWELIQSDSYFSGVVFRFAREENEIDYEHVICGTYFS